MTSFQIENKMFILFCLQLEKVPYILYWAKGWEFDLSLIHSSLFCSISLILNSKSLSSLFKKERCESLKKKHIFMFLTVFPLFMQKIESLLLLFAHPSFLKCDLSYSLPSLLTKERLLAFRERFALFTSKSLFCQKNEQFARKTDERIPYAVLNGST